MKSIFNKSIFASFLLGALLLLSNHQSSAQCVADFTWSASGATVSFKDSSTSNTTLYYYWQFGDGSYSAAQNPTHSYQKAGTYTTCLYVYDSTKSCVDSTCKQVTVASGNGGGGSTGGCQAYFYATPSGLALALKNASKTTTSNATYLWTFGDGDSSTQTHPSHTYASAGTYTVCLILTDSACSDTFCKQYTVSNANSGNCTASFKYQTSGNTVWVSNQSSAGQGNVTYAWSWGDGNSSTGSSPGSHNYASNGTYTICLVLYNSTTSCSDSDCQQVTVKSGNGNCKASYTDSATGNFSFAFTNTSNTLNSGTAKYYWQFGDGTYDSTTNTTHTYAKAGTYNVCLKVKDGNCYDIYCKTITVGGNQSTCQAWWGDSVVTGTNQVYFVDASKYTQGNQPAYAWDFGDGNYSSQQNPNHTYSKTGTYYVCLTISDSARGCSDTRCDYVTVGKANTGCAAKFVYSAQAKTVAFQNKSTGTSPNSTTCTWSFGDGSSATGYNATHSYASMGTYTVCLTISDSNCSDTFCTSVYVGNKFWLKGAVSLGNNNSYPDFGKVWAIHYDSTAGTLTAIDSTYTDSTTGKYAFYLMPGYYLIKAALESKSRDYSSYLPTYYNDKLHWDTANLVALFSNTQNINIHLIAGNNPGGPGFIGGKTSQGANKTGAVGDPVEGVEIVLYDDQKNPIAYTYSDSKGEFGFNNLKYGTYEVHPELLGKASLPMMVTISANKMSVGDVVVEVNTNYASVALGIFRSQQSIASGIKVYPNPANSILNIEVEGNTSFLSTVTDMQGRSTGIIALQEGNRMRLDVSSLASGMYILNLTAKDGNSYKQRFVKQ